MFRSSVLLTLLFFLPLSAHAALPAFESKVRAYEKSDRRSPPPQGAILFAGSSSIEMWSTMANDFSGLVTLNRGIGGSQYRDLIKYTARIIVPYHPSKLVLYSGDNDIAAGKTAEQIAELVRTLLTQLRASLPDMPILIISVKPSLAQRARLDEIRKTNTLLETLVTGFTRVQFVDVQSAMLDDKLQPKTELFRKDGLHMNARGYALWKNILTPFLTAP